MKPKNNPFCWQDKRVLRLIREQCMDPASALSVYVALTEIASDMQKEEFQTTVKYISGKCCFSRRTVTYRLHDLVKIGAVAIATPRLKAPSTYKLLPIGNGCPTLGNGCRAMCSESTPNAAPIRRIEEKKDPPTPKAKSEPSVSFDEIRKGCL